MQNAKQLPNKNKRDYKMPINGAIMPNNSRLQNLVGSARVGSSPTRGTTWLNSFNNPFLSYICYCCGVFVVYVLSKVVSLALLLFSVFFVENVEKSYQIFTKFLLLFFNSS